MKILKSNTGQVFDSENINSVEAYIGEKPDICHALQQNIPTTIYEFLRLDFPEGHEIFKNFEGSYYYCISTDVKKTVTANFPGIGNVEISQERAKQIRTLQMLIRERKVCECEIPYFPTGDIHWCSKCNRPTVY